jgi:hypothetical protein
MKYMMKGILGLISIACLFCCASKAQITEAFPQKIENVYFQKWIGGQELTGTGTNFFIELKQPLSKEIQLQKIYFQNQDAVCQQVNDTLIAAYFHRKPNGENNKESAITQKPKYNLLPNEAVIEYAYKNKKAFFKIVAIKEKELIAYPSSRPRN